MIEAVVFDMDGVIIDSEPVWQTVRVEFMEQHGASWTGADGDACRGRASSVWSSRMAERVDGAMAPQEIFRSVVQRMTAAYETSLPLFPGAVEKLREVASKYTVAVASGSPRALIDVVLSISGIAAFCSAVGYGDEVPRGKPAPDIYNDVLSRLGVAASNAVGVEDSESGLRSLHAAGMYSIAVISPRYGLPRDVLDATSATISGLDSLTLSVIDSIG